ncbi:MAG: hypothetical protein ABIY55_20605 [Kofleriaceae bacterium]
MRVPIYPRLPLGAQISLTSRTRSPPQQGMKRFCCSWLVVMGLAHAAAAQAPGQVEPATASFLEKRVPEELASEGVVLSRNNLGLKLEQVGPQWLVSLVDLSTARIAASTKLDVLPPDREAAVATMTHVVAELATQIVGRAEHPPAPSAPSAAPPPSSTEHEVAELKFKRQSIRFGTAFLVGNGSFEQVESGRGWRAFQGDLNEAMTAEQFYTAVGRPELIQGYNQRRTLGTVALVVGGVGLAAAFALSFSSGADDPDFGRNVDIAIGVGAVCIGVTIIGIHYRGHAHPIDAQEAKALADAYNQGLRRQLGLPVAARQPVLRDVKIAPFATGTTGGLALSARF